MNEGLSESPRQQDGSECSGPKAALDQAMAMAKAMGRAYSHSEIRAALLAVAHSAGEYENAVTRGDYSLDDVMRYVNTAAKAMKRNGVDNVLVDKIADDIIPPEEA